MLAMARLAVNENTADTPMTRAKDIDLTSYDLAFALAASCFSCFSIRSRNQIRSL
jgi:hypothetical protein